MSKLIFSPTTATEIKVGERYVVNVSEVDAYNDGGDIPNVLTVDEYYPHEDTGGFIVEGIVQGDDEDDEPSYKYSELLSSDEVVFFVEEVNQ